MKTILNNPGRYKAAIERLYTGVCAVDVKENVTDETTHKTRPQVVRLYEDVPCRLSHNSKDVTGSYERNRTPQNITLFLDNELEIPAGCRITVTQDNVTNEYGCASEPNVFETHQEINLELWRDWSEGRSKRRD